MPRAVIATGVADIVLPVRELAARLAELARSKERIDPARPRRRGRGADPDGEEKALQGVLELLRKRTGHDFSKYKRTTVLRRLSRRMQLSAPADAFTTTAQFLRARRTARDGRALRRPADLGHDVLSRSGDLGGAAGAGDRAAGGPRCRRTSRSVSGSGCATGEEAYTLAILFQEEFERREHHRNLIIFASDVDEARAGTSRAKASIRRRSRADVSEARLERYFRVEDDHYRVVQRGARPHRVRRAQPAARSAVFAPAPDLLPQPAHLPRSRAAGAGHGRLPLRLPRRRRICSSAPRRPPTRSSFVPVDKKHRIFAARARGGRRRAARCPRSWRRPATRPRARRATRGPRRRPSAAESAPRGARGVAPPSAARRRALERAAPVGLGGAIHPAERRPAGAARDRAREAGAARRAARAAAPGRGAHEPQLSPFVPVALRRRDAPRRAARAAAGAGRDGRRHMLVTFLDLGEVDAGRRPAERAEPRELAARPARAAAPGRAAHRQRARRSFLTNEDLRAANEELQSLNEEYRSTTEELETSKEELQSINEELQTVNHELKMKLEEISRAHSDLENLMAATDVATLFLSPDLRIKRFTPQLGELFNIKSARPRPPDRRPDAHPRLRDARRGRTRGAGDDEPDRAHRDERRRACIHRAAQPVSHVGRPRQRRRRRDLRRRDRHQEGRTRASRERAAAGGGARDHAPAARR